MSEEEEATLDSGDGNGHRGSLDARQRELNSEPSDWGDRWWEQDEYGLDPGARRMLGAVWEVAEGAKPYQCIAQDEDAEQRGPARTEPLTPTEFKNVYDGLRTQQMVDTLAGIENGTNLLRVDESLGGIEEARDRSVSVGQDLWGQNILEVARDDAELGMASWYPPDVDSVDLSPGDLGTEELPPDVET